MISKEVKEDKVQLAHGAGGRKMDELIHFITQRIDLKTPKNGGYGLETLDDGAVVSLSTPYEVIISTDAHTIQPIFFPGGDIGRLAMTGTINDVAVMGAKPVAIALSMVIEEGFTFEKLDKILQSINAVSLEAGVPIITGDTKVMPAGTIDEIVITTTGIGLASRDRVVIDNKIEPGDQIIVSGTVGDHGIAILSHREGLTFETELVSDLAPLNKMIEKVLEITTPKAMRDPTRGGLASTLNDFASMSNVGLVIDEDAIPIKPAVKAACEMLGFDPLHVSCEGKVVLAVEKEVADEVVSLLKKDRYGKEAAIIGEATADNNGRVVLETGIGGKRILQKPLGELIPRVC